ncbi:MAG: hypothetical protein WCF84_09600 [Anaerolineae bacterium]
MQQLYRANQLLMNGQAAEAAALFAQLAVELERLGHPRRAANLHVQAARAYAEARIEKNATEEGRTALNQFLQLGMAQRAARFYQNVRRRMQELGMKGAADALQKEFEGKVPKVEAGDAPAAKGRLPAKCSQCGAPVRSDEVDWIDAHSAECVYCGSVVQTES